MKPPARLAPATTPTKARLARGSSALAPALLAALSLVTQPSCNKARGLWRKHVSHKSTVDPVRARQVREGRRAYLRYCALCHAPDATGYRADHANAIGNGDFLAIASDAFLRAAIADGHPGTPMSAWGRAHGGPLDDATVNNVIAFLRSRSSQRRVALDDHRATRPDPNRVRGVFSERCAQCHGSAGEGTARATSLSHPNFLRTVSDGFLRHTIVHGRRGTPMTGFGSVLDAQALDDMVALIRSFERDPVAARGPVPAGPPPPGLDQLVMNPTGRPPVFTLREDRFVPAAQVLRAVNERRRMIILDARAVTDWNLGHIPGALPFPFYDIEQMATQIPRDGTWILAYCACPHAASGHVVDELRRRNFTHTAVIDEGIMHWMSQHYPTVRNGVTDPPVGTTPSAAAASSATPSASTAPHAPAGH